MVSPAEGSGRPAARTTPPAGVGTRRFWSIRRAVVAGVNTKYSFNKYACTKRSPHTDCIVAKTIFQIVEKIGNVGARCVIRT